MDTETRRRDQPINIQTRTETRRGDSGSADDLSFCLLPNRF